MSRKLYIVDRPPGPEGGARYEFRMFASAFTAQRNANPRSAAMSSTPRRDAGWVLVVDLDELPKHEATDAELYEHAERMLMHYTAEEARLRPALRDGAAPPDSRQKRIDGVLDAARAWRRQYEKRCERPSFKPTRRETLLFHALVHLDDEAPCACGKATHPDGCEEWCDGGK
jgi:hypothetical protein